MICRYWWSQQDGKDKCHWVSWERMTKSKKEGGLGLRDLHLFNMAMLSRQSWRLLQFPDTLCATVLKAKYFPECSILEVVAQPGASYTWRSILLGRDLLKEGIVWRIGDGTSVRVWTDPWIPRGSSRQPATHQGHAIVSKVSELINPVTDQWNEALVRMLFSEEDAHSILAILLRQGMEDFISWHFDKRGQFSVKSAYQLGVAIRERSLHHDASTSAIQEQGSPLWNKLWPLGVPSKVRLFTWRLAHNSLPTRLNINRKQIELDTRCPMCLRLDEDGGHLFLKCKKVKALWRERCLEDIRVALCECKSPKEVLGQIWTLPQDKQVHVVSLLWDWWTARNKLSFRTQAPVHGASLRGMRRALSLLQQQANLIMSKTLFRLKLWLVSRRSRGLLTWELIGLRLNQTVRFWWGR